MTFSAVGTLTSVLATTGSTQTFTLAPGTVGNLIWLAINWQPSGNTVSIATANAGIIWLPSGMGKVTNSNLGGGTQSVSFQMFLGIAQLTSSQITTITYSAAITSARYDYQQFTSSNLPHMNYKEVTFGSTGATSGTSMVGPNFASGAGNLGIELWVVDNATSSVSGTGWSAVQTDSASNGESHNLNTGATAQATGTQSATGGWFSLGTVLTDAPGSRNPIGVDSGYGSFFYCEDEYARGFDSFRRPSLERQLRPAHRHPRRGVRSVDRSGLRQWERRGGVRIG